MIQIHCHHQPSVEYCAVFVVPTPTIGHTGISHLAEHMCFRGSEKYPADHELFVANSLLPISINASTQSDITYFYVKSADEQLFLQGIDYLFASLGRQDYQPATFLKERDGVLAQELRLLESDQTYAKLAAVRRGDASLNAYRHAGGFSDTIDKITLDELNQYVATVYRPENITLMYSTPCNANISINFRQKIRAELGISRLRLVASGRAGESEVSLEVNPPLNPTPECERRKDQTPVTTWWVPASYRESLKHVEADIAARFASQGEYIVEEDINHLGLIALRFIHHASDKDSNIDSTDTLVEIVSFLQSLQLEAKPIEFSDRKLPGSIQTLIRSFHTNQNGAHKSDAQESELEDIYADMQLPNTNHSESSHAIPSRIKPLSDYLSTPSTSYLAPLPMGQPHTPRFASDIAHASRFAARNSHLLALTSVPALPGLLVPLAKRALHNDEFASSAKNWVYPLSKLQESELINTAVTAEFWQPRTQGECYAMGIGKYHHRVFIFAAQDERAKQRENWCDSLFVEHHLCEQ